MRHLESPPKNASRGLVGMLGGARFPTSTVGCSVSKPQHEKPEKWGSRPLNRKPKTI